jgi:hypothetical protein
MSHHHKTRHKSIYHNPDQHSRKTLFAVGAAFATFVIIGLALVVRGLMH